MTDCLNFGDPTKPEVYFQLSQAVRGMSEACSALDTPVISGNVSLYNETAGRPVYPTPVVGALGVLEDVSRHLRSGFAAPGTAVPSNLATSRRASASSVRSRSASGLRLPSSRM